MIDIKKVAVLGGGAVALATSAELISAGFTVNMFELPEFRENIKSLMNEKRIEFSGVIGNGFTDLNLVTTEAEKALYDVGLIILAVPAFGHQAFVEACVPYLQNEQIFLIETAYFGCLRFAKAIESSGKKVIMAEMNHSPYTCTKVSPNHICIDAKREEVYIAALPAVVNVTKLLEPLKSIYPKMKPAANVLQTSLDNVNWIAHPTITLFHMGLIERTAEYILPLKDSLSHSVIRLMEAFEKERLALGKAFGLNLLPIKHTFELGGETLEEALRMSSEFETFKYEYKDGSNQYLIEDLYYALPPLASFSRQVGVPVNSIDAVLKIFSVINNVDYMAEGVNVDKMGLTGLSIEDILKLVEKGYY